LPYYSDLTLSFLSTPKPSTYSCCSPYMAEAPPIFLCFIWPPKWHLVRILER